MLTRLTLVLVASGLWTIAGTFEDISLASFISQGLSPEAQINYETSVSNLLDSLGRSHTQSEDTAYNRSTRRGRRGVRKGKQVHDDRGVYRLNNVEAAFSTCKYNRHFSWTTWRNSTYAVCISAHDTATFGRLKATGWVSLDTWALSLGQQSVIFQYNDVLYTVVADEAKPDGTDLLRYNTDSSVMDIDHTIHSRYATAITLWRMNADDEKFHLAIANSYGPGSDFFLDYTYTYEWHETYFDHYDSVQSYYVRDLESFHIFGKSYLVVANHKTGKEMYDVDSEVFRFDSEEWRWKSFQKIRTKAVMDVHFFQMGPENAPDFFLIFANQFEIKNGQRNYAVNSEVFKFVGDRFVPFQCLQTHGANGVSAYTDSRTGAFLLAISNSYSPVQLFQYDGWNFIPAPVQSAAESMAPGAHALVFHPWAGFNAPQDQLALVVSNPRKEMESSVFVLSFSWERPIRQWYSDGLDWCRQAEQRFNLTRPSDMVQVLDNAYYSHEDQPVILDRPVIFQDGLTISRSLEAPKVVDLHQNNILDYALLFHLQSLESRLHVVNNRIEELKSTLSISVRTTGTQTITGNLELDSLSASCTNADCEISSVETKFLNDKNIEHLKSKVLFLDQPNTIIGSLKFEELHVEGDITVSGLVDGVNLSHVVSRNQNRIIISEKTFAHTVVATNINIQGTLDGVQISPEYILLTEGDQVVEGEMTFTEVELQDIHIEGVVGGVNLHEFYEDVVILGGGVQHVTGSKILKGPVTLRDLHLETGKINGVDMVDLWNNVVRLDTDQDIYALWNFSQMSLVNPIAASVNGIEIPGPQVIISGEGDLLIPDHQVFAGQIIIDSLEVDESLNGLTNIPSGPNECANQLNLVLRSCDQTISGLKTFASVTLGAKNFVTGKINNFDLSVLEDHLLHRTLNITEDWSFNQVEIRAPVLVKQELVGWEVEDLYMRALKLGQPLPENAHVQFKNKLNVERLICEDVNGVDVERDLFLRHGSAAVTSKKTWENLVLLEDSKIVGKVNGLDMNFLQDVLRNGQEVQVLHETRIVEGDLTVSKLDLKGKLSGLDMSRAISLNMDLTFGVPVSLQNVQVNSEMLADSIAVHSGIVNGHNFQQLLNDTMLYNSNVRQRVTGKKILTGDLIVPEGLDLHVGLVNGIDLQSLARDTLYRDRAQHVTGLKTFVKPVRFHDLILNGSIGGVSDWDIFNNWMIQDKTQTVTGDVSFHAGLKVEGDVKVQGLINGVDLQALQDDIIRTKEPFEATGELNLKHATVLGDLMVSGKVQGVRISEEAVIASGDKLINGRKTFKNLLINGDLFVETINGVKMDELCQQTARKTGPLNLDEVVVRGDLKVLGALRTSAAVNDLLLEDFRRSVVMLNESHHFSNVVFKDIVFQQPLILQGTLNEVDVRYLEKNYMSLSREQDVFEKVEFQGLLTVEGPVGVEHMTTARNMIGMVNITRMAQNILTKHSQQTMLEKLVITGNLRFLQDLTVQSTLNGLRIPEDIGLKSRSNVVKSKVIFSSDLTVTSDLDLSNGATVQGIDVSEWASQTVKTTGHFTLTGVKKFNNIRVQDVRALDLFGGTAISESTILLKKRKQSLKGRVSFGGTVHVKGSLNTSSEINGVLVSNLINESVLKSRPAVITGRKTFLHPLTIKRLHATGHVANVNLTELALLIRRPYDLEILNLQLSEKCQSLASFGSFLSDTPHKLNYYEDWISFEEDKGSDVRIWGSMPFNASSELLVLSKRTDGSQDFSQIHFYVVNQNGAVATAVLPIGNTKAVELFQMDQTKYLAVSSCHDQCGVRIFFLNPFSGTWELKQVLSNLAAEHLSVLSSNPDFLCLASAGSDQILVHCYNHQTDLLEPTQKIILDGVDKVSLASCHEGVFLAASAFQNGVWSVLVYSWSDQTLVFLQSTLAYYPEAGPVFVSSLDKSGYSVCMLVIGESNLDRRITFPTTTYRLDGVRKLFVEDQRLPVKEVVDVHWNKLPSDDLFLYLLTQDGVHVYLWTGESGFVYYDFIYYPDGSRILGFSNGNWHYLIVSGLNCDATCSPKMPTKNAILKAKIKGQ